MAKAPSPITSPPSVPGQPYNASAPGAPEDQTAATTIYDAVGGPGAAEPWVKVQDGGACGPDGTASGNWPGNGTSSDGGWKQL